MNIFNAAAEIIKQRKLNFQPQVAIVLGSGLGQVAEQITDATIIPYNELPNFPKCTTQGHSGLLYLGYIHKTPVICLQGRAHFYEGTDPIVIKNLIRTPKLLGCDTLILISACGSLNNENPAGSIAMITDHLNFQFANTLTGPNDDEFGPRFPSLDNAYDAELRRKFMETASKINLKSI
jgi:xanthosine phosphorylase